MKQSFFIVLALAVVGCNSPGEGEPETRRRERPGYSADNTGTNERDQEMEESLTPEDQGGDADRTITQLVRQGVVEAFGATTNAGNVKIVTVDRVVTLRGPVNSATEQSTIVAIARRVERVRQVNNQLEVISNQ